MITYEQLVAVWNGMCFTSTGVDNDGNELGNLTAFGNTIALLGGDAADLAKTRDALLAMAKAIDDVLPESKRAMDVLSLGKAKGETE